MIGFRPCLMLCVFAMLSTLNPAASQAHECVMNEVVANYLKANPGWSIVKLSDLSEDDKNLWKLNHQGLCPGLASAKLDSKHTWYALALISEAKGKIYEKLVSLKVNRPTVTSYLLSSPQIVVEPFVVWRTRPGTYLDYHTGKKIMIRHDSFVYEKIESASVQFYLHDGRIQKLIASY